VLGGLRPGQLDGCLFPLGEWTKPQVRAHAEALGLKVAAKPDSHDICFIPTGDTAGFLRERLGAAPGEVIDAQTGQVLGGHDGAYAFTIGQRRGVGLGRPAADGARRYVVDVDIATRRVAVGPVALLEVAELTALDARWTGSVPDGPLNLGVQVRAHGDEVPARVEVADFAFHARLDRPLVGVAPGQAAVLYEGTRVVGSGTIMRDPAAGR
jgi:tRNA-uridine 2-sulfurtransferase